MFKNLHLKFIALFFATIFWIFVVSLENTFFRLPQEVNVQVFNQTPELALARPLGSVKLTLRTQDAIIVPSLSPNDFEAYVDLRNVGAGIHRLTILVTSKNPQVSVVRAEPPEIEVELEPVKEKSVNVTPEVTGMPAGGFKIDSVKLSLERVTVSGAQSKLSKIGSAKAKVELTGGEKLSLTKTVSLVIYDRAGGVMEDLQVTPHELEALVNISEAETSRLVGVRAMVSGTVVNGTVKQIQVTPGVVSVTGNREIINGLEVIETEKLDLKDFETKPEQKAKLVLPLGVVLTKGQSGEVTVRVEFEKVPVVPLVPVVAP
ncbi:MAG: CdaR family protein [Patescibacteria group bacterium]